MKESIFFRAFIFLASFVLILFLISCFGYFIMPSVIENKASALIEENAGFPAKVEIDVPFSFIFTGEVKKAQIYIPSIQTNDGFNVRHLELETRPFKLNLLSILSGNFQNLQEITATGTFIITPDDINSYLKSKGKQFEVSINDNEIYVTSYVSGIGKIIVKGRLVPNSSGASFQAENIVEPKLPSLIFFPQLWSNISFDFSIEPLDQAFKIEKYFIDKKFIKVYFSLDKEFIKEISNDIFSE